jgi:hypothetical protein
MITRALPAAEALPQQLHEFTPVRRSPDSPMTGADPAGRDSGVRFCTRLKFFRDLSSIFCNAIRRIAG